MYGNYSRMRNYEWAKTATALKRLKGIYIQQTDCPTDRMIALTMRLRTDDWQEDRKVGNDDDTGEQNIFFAHSRLNTLSGSNEFRKDEKVWLTAKGKKTIAIVITTETKSGTMIQMHNGLSACVLY